MKRMFVLPLFVFVFLLSACSGSSPTAASGGAPANAATSGKAAATAPEAPTATIGSTKVVLATATTAPTETPSGPVMYSETFDKPDDLWSDPVIVTTQASGHDPNLKINVDSGAMGFAINEKETYVYKMFLYTVDGTSSTTITYTPKGAMNSGIAAVCKADKELTAWYEVRLISGQSKYAFYAYNKKLKTEEHKNPYVLLSEGGLTTQEFQSAMENTFTFTCADKELKLDLNKGKKVVTQATDGSLKGNLIGIGAMSYDMLPITIDFETVVIQQIK